MRCNSMDFNVPNGSLLKFAVSRNSDRFLGDVLNWGLALNHIDPANGRTVLDYIQGEIARNRQAAVQRTLRRYYQMLRERGAMHRREMP
jgi:hypothetical protein